MSRLLVRCCCNPRKILGSLPWDGVQERAIFGVSRVVLDGPAMVALEVGTFSDAGKCSDALLAASLRDPLVAAQVREFFYRERAYKSEDTPIETLRLIRDFIEAPPQLPSFDYVCPYCFQDLRTCPCGDKEKNS